MNFALYGECFWKLIREGGWITQIDILPPPQIQHKVSDTGKFLAWEYNAGMVHETIPDDDMIQFKTVNPLSKWRGISPLTAAGLGINVDFAASLYNYFFFNNDSTPAGVIKTDQELTNEEANSMRIRWKQQQGGLNKKGNIAVFGKGGDYKPIALAQKDIQYIEQKKWSQSEVFAVLNVPSALSQVLEFASIKSNIKEQRQQLFENNLIPKMRWIEDVLKTQFFDREKIPLVGEFDTSGISALKDTVAEKVTSARQLFDMGVPFNMINDKLEFGFDPLPWGDQGYMPMTMVPAGQPPPEKNPDETLPQKSKAVSVIVKKRTDPTLAAENILHKVNKYETRFKKELQDYFYKMRSDVLNRVINKKSVKLAIEQSYSDILPDEEDYDKLIIEIARPVYTEVFDIGLRGLNEAIGTNVSMASARAQAIITDKTLKLREVNDTIREQIIKDTRPIIQDAIKEGLSYQNVADRIADEVKNIFNNVRRRTETVARTEINGTLSASRSAGMQEAGVEEIQWISTRLIRQIHNENHLQHRKYYIEKFPSGIYEPYDPDAGPENVINCSCIAVPYEFEG
jgi:HK97 family phage portal protein